MQTWIKGDYPGEGLLDVSDTEGDEYAIRLHRGTHCPEVCNLVCTVILMKVKEMER